MNISELRNDYMLKTLDESDVDTDPIVQFKIWMEEALKSNLYEPTAMALACVDREGKPSVRIVLLKQIRNDGFIFFTNYESRKGRELLKNPNAAAVVYWSELQRQIRIEGLTEKISAEESDLYFNSRPEGSKLSALISPQSQVITNRKILEDKIFHLTSSAEEITISRPAHWGGFIIKPFRMEFWQGRMNRLHDRIQYTRENDSWRIERLAP